jgi:flagella basal body P-ring formation protein FlgA
MVTVTKRIATIFLLVFLGLGYIPALAVSPVYGLGSGSTLAEADDTKTLIIKQARQQLENRFASGKYRFDLQPRWIPSRLLKRSPQQIIGTQLQGAVRRYTNFKVVYQQQGNRKSAEIQLKVKVKQKLPVVVSRVERGKKLTTNKLTIQWVTLSQNQGTYITDLEKLKGKTLRRTLLSGQPVRKSYVSRDLIVKAGDEVKVVINKMGIQVQVTGSARENGAKGDRIKVYSNETRKKYVGEIIRPGVIQWKSTL